jgi:hydrocephalus-inducing protein
LFDFTFAAAAGGTEVALDVVYEPSRLGDSATQLVVTSNEAGEYSCSLHGHCTPPQPQGPILVKGGSPVAIPISNPFLKTAQFLLNIDNVTSFAIKPNELSLGSKKIATVFVSYKNNSTGITAGKLTVTTEESPTTPWIYYLKGSN